MYKFAFTYLVKQDLKTWRDFEISLSLLYKNILSKLSCNYKIIIFCEGEPLKKVRCFINYLSIEKNINIKIKKINLSAYVKRKKTDKYIKNFPHAANCKLTTSLSYRDMCKFFAIDVFFDDLLKDTDYFIRLDTDSYFLFSNKNFINDLNLFCLDYGFINNTIQKEDKAVTLGFGKCLYDFYKKTLSKSTQKYKYINF